MINWIACPGGGGGGGGDSDVGTVCHFKCKRTVFNVISLYGQLKLCIVGCPNDMIRWTILYSRQAQRHANNGKSKWPNRLSTNTCTKLFLIAYSSSIVQPCKLDFFVHLFDWVLLIYLYSQMLCSHTASAESSQYIESTSSNRAKSSGTKWEICLRFLWCAICWS